MHAAVSVLYYRYVNAIGNIETMFGENRFGLTDESSLERLVFPTLRKYVGECISLFSHDQSPIR